MTNFKLPVPLTMTSSLNEPSAYESEISHIRRDFAARVSEFVDDDWMLQHVFKFSKHQIDELGNAERRTRPGGPV